MAGNGQLGLEEAKNSQQHHKPPSRAASQEKPSAPLPSTGTSQTVFPASVGSLPPLFPTVSLPIL